MKLLSGAMVFSLALGSQLVGSSFAQAQTYCVRGALTNIYNFSVYAANSMRVSNSDFQGLVGAGNSIQATGFRFGPVSEGTCGVSVSVGQYFYGQSGSIDGTLELAGANSQYQLGQNSKGDYSFTVDSAQYSQYVNHPVVIQQLADASSYFRTLVPSKDVKVNVGTAGLNIVLGQSTVEVVKLKAGDLRAGRNVRLAGRPGQTLIINVDSNSVDFSGLTLQVSGLYIRDIIWNFYEATSLKLAHLAGKNSTYAIQADGGDASLGMQGYVLAPRANVDFSSTKLTGSLLAGSVVTNEYHSGQVNVAPYQGPVSPCLLVDYAQQLASGQAAVTYGAVDVPPEQPLH